MTLLLRERKKYIRVKNCIDCLTRMKEHFPAMLAVYSLCGSDEIDFFFCIFSIRFIPLNLAITFFYLILLWVVDYIFRAVSRHRITCVAYPFLERKDYSVNRGLDSLCSVSLNFLSNFVECNYGTGGLGLHEFAWC